MVLLVSRQRDGHACFADELAKNEASVVAVNDKGILGLLNTVINLENLLQAGVSDSASVGEIAYSDVQDCVTPTRGSQSYSS